MNNVKIFTENGLQTEVNGLFSINIQDGLFKADVIW